MAITPVDKIKIIKYLKDNPIGEIYYLDLCNALGKKCRIKDIEFLEFFVDSVIKEFKKDDKISINFVSKLVVTVESFLEWVHEAGTSVDESLLDKIRSFEEYYDEYLNRTNYDIDLVFTDGYLASVLNTVGNLYPKEEKSESVVQYLNQIEELKTSLSSLKREYDNLMQSYESLQKKADKKSDDYVQKSDDYSRALNTISSKEKEISKLNETIGKLERQIADLEKTLERVSTDLSFYEPFKKLYDDTLSELHILKEQIELRAKEELEKKKNNEKDARLVSTIYSHLIDGRASLDDIISHLKKTKEVNFDRNKVYSLLKELKKKINIETSSFSLRPSYEIVTPPIMESGEFYVDVPEGCKHYDILLVSDFHIKEFDSKLLNGFDTINNYCVENNIQLILNLGDFFHGVGSKNLEYDFAMQNYALAEKAISLIPRVDGVYHAVLGGNHDKNILKYGFDPIDMITREREDFINLGYTHGTIVFDGACSVLGKIDIHHPQRFDFPIDFEDDGIDTTKLNSYLNSLYASIGRDRNDSYIDIFGHTHKSLFNYPESYCFIPSFFEGRSKKGACHLRIYLDPKNGFKYMVFMPLNCSDKLIKNNEIVYQKMLTR